MQNFIRIFLKKYFPNIYNSTFKIRKIIYKTMYTNKQNINILKTFNQYVPNVSGENEKKIQDTIYNINTYPIKLLNLSFKKYEITDINKQFDNKNSKLGELFLNYGSDKKTHNYDLLYNYVFSEYLKKNEIEYLIEIGIGSKNLKILSNMSQYGKPGASLRAFRDYLPNTKIIGLEYDKSILFNENRIETFFYDQISQDSLQTFSTKFKNKIDILIDDGLHSIIANINSILLAKEALKVNGYLIIEDISPDSIELFFPVFNLIEKEFEIKLFTNKSSIVASLKKL